MCPVQVLLKKYTIDASGSATFAWVVDNLHYGAIATHTAAAALAFFVSTSDRITVESGGDCDQGRGSAWAVSPFFSLGYDASFPHLTGVFSLDNAGTVLSPGDQVEVQGRGVTWSGPKAAYWIRVRLEASTNNFDCSGGDEGSLPVLPNSVTNKKPCVWTQLIGPLGVYGGVPDASGVQAGTVAPGNAGQWLNYPEVKSKDGNFSFYWSIPHKTKAMTCGAVSSSAESCGDTYKGFEYYRDPRRPPNSGYFHELDSFLDDEDVVLRIKLEALATVAKGQQGQFGVPFEPTCIQDHNKDSQCTQDGRDVWQVYSGLFKIRAPTTTATTTTTTATTTTANTASTTNTTAIFDDPLLGWLTSTTTATTPATTTAAVTTTATAATTATIRTTVPDVVAPVTSTSIASGCTVHTGYDISSGFAHFSFGERSSATDEACNSICTSYPACKLAQPTFLAPFLCPSPTCLFKSHYLPDRHPKLYQHADKI